MYNINYLSSSDDDPVNKLEVNLENLKQPERIDISYEDINDSYYRSSFAYFRDERLIGVIKQSQKYYQGTIDVVSYIVSLALYSRSIINKKLREVKLKNMYRCLGDSLIIKGDPFVTVDMSEPAIGYIIELEAYNPSNESEQYTIYIDVHGSVVEHDEWNEAIPVTVEAVVKCKVNGVNMVKSFAIACALGDVFSESIKIAKL